MSTFTNYYNINNYFENFEKNNEKNQNILIKDRNNFINSLKNRYNNLSEDTRKILNYTLHLLNINKNLEISLQEVKHDYNSLQANYSVCCTDLFDTKMKLEQLKTTTPEDNLCCICMTNQKECVYVNCGHVCACVTCCERMDTQCPICRQNGNYIKLISV